MRVSAESNPDGNSPTHLAVSGIEPGNVGFRVLTDLNAEARARSDPEYYITRQGPFVYYNRYIPASVTGGSRKSEGVWRIDMGLGPPVLPP